jgi:gamma-glutamylcyclotransferase (GGCT)/AIG2-like uncharacterized protein YtfP
MVAAVVTEKKEADNSIHQGIRVAVYGSLREGLGNHVCLTEYGAEKLGVHVLEETEGYRMVSLGGFPAVLPADDALQTPITIEVYRVNDQCLQILDSLEGHPDWYRRERVETPWKKAWMYVMQDSDYADHNPVDSGDWLDYYTSGHDY